MKYFRLPPIRVHLFGFIFSPRWVPTGVTLFLFPFLISLGMWQLHRGAEKRKIEEVFRQQGHAVEMSHIKHFNAKHLQYRTLVVRGYFDNQHQIFLDNKTYHQQIGYHVLTPFILPKAQKVLLVNRGFVPIKSRNEWPNVEVGSGPRVISGLIYFPTKTWVLREEPLGTTWPLRMQSLDLLAVERKYHQPVMPFYLLLKTGDSSPLIRDWHPVNFPASRHLGYAIQWFSLAVTLMVIYLKLNISKEG